MSKTAVNTSYASEQFPTVSSHFFARASQRRLNARDIAFVLKHGRVHYATGIKFVFLGRRDIPERQRRDAQIARLEGVTVLLAHDGGLITVYKNPAGLPRIKRKAKRYLPVPARRSLSVVRRVRHS